MESLRKASYHQLAQITWTTKTSGRCPDANGSLRIANNCFAVWSFSRDSCPAKVEVRAWISFPRQSTYTKANLSELCGNRCFDMCRRGDMVNMILQTMNVLESEAIVTSVWAVTSQIQSIHNLSIGVTLARTVRGSSGGDLNRLFSQLAMRKSCNPSTTRGRIRHARITGQGSLLQGMWLKREARTAMIWITSSGTGAEK